MRITFVVPENTISGGLRVVSIYAELLAARGHSVTVAVRNLKYNRWKEALRHPRQLPRILREGPPKQGFFQTGKGYEVKTIPDRDKTDETAYPDADVIIATWWETAEWVKDFSSKKGRKFYFVQHHEVFDYLPVDRVAATYRIQAFHKIAVSRWIQDIMASEYADFTTSLVPNSVDLALFNAPPRTKQTAPTIGFYHSDQAWKGSDRAMQIIEQIKTEQPEVQIVAFGQVPLPTDWTHAQDVRYYLSPAQSELSQIYSQCDAWLFTSRLEGFGLPILEALACRTPVIGSPAGAMPEISKRGGCMLVQDDSNPAFCQAFKDLISLSDHQWQALSQQAYANASSFTWEDAASALDEILYKYSKVSDESKRHAA